MTTNIVTRWRTDGLSFLEDVLTLPDSRSYGASLDGWQRQDFAAAFGDKHIWWERPRGHSKTMDAGALALHHLLSAPGRRAYVGAVDRDQGSLAHASLREFILRSELLQRTLKVDRWKIVAPSTDSTLEVLSADAASSWGLRPSLVVVDEFSAWRGDAAEELFYSLYSALGKVRGARMVIATTAGWDRTSLCWKLREQVMGDSAWAFSRIGQCASWVSPDFLEQQQRLLPEHVYRRLHGNEWAEAGGAYLTYAEVEGIFAGERVLECQSGSHYLGLDIGLSGDATAACVLHRDGETVSVHDIATWQGTRGEKVRLEDVEQWVKDAALHRYSGAVLHADPWQAVGLLQRLGDAGVRCEEPTFSQQYRGHLFQNLLELVRGRKLRCFPHEVLKDELLRLEFREVGGNLRVDHPSGGHDDHAVSVAVAALAAVQGDHDVPFIDLPEWDGLAGFIPELGILDPGADLVVAVDRVDAGDEYCVIIVTRDWRRERWQQAVAVRSVHKLDRQGVEELLIRLKPIHITYTGAVGIEPLMADLRHGGLWAEAFPSSQSAEAELSLRERIVSGHVAHGGDGELRASIAAAVLDTAGSTPKMVSRGRGDLSLTKALAMAVSKCLYLNLRGGPNEISGTKGDV